MRVLAMSDLHGFPAVFAAIPRLVERHAAAAVVLAGDLLRNVGGRGSRAEGFRACGRALSTALRGIGVPVLFVMGNDDVVDWEPDLSRAENLHGRRVEIGPWNFVGYAPTLPFAGGDFERTEDEMAADLGALAPLVDGETVLVTHGPVHGVLDDTLPGHAGSRSLLRLVEERRPLLHIHGHIHESFGREGIHLNVASGGRVRGMLVDLATLRHEEVGP